MQRPNEKKRQKIVDTAAKLFANKPFHEVRLDDVAAAAGVGKGTLYIYFKNKEDLYVSLIHDGFVNLVQQFHEEMATAAPADCVLERMIGRMVSFAHAHPGFFELMRATQQVCQREELMASRRQATDLILATLQRGVREGVWNDAHPELTASFIPGLVRSAMLYGPAGLTEEVLTEQIIRLLRRGLLSREQK